VAELPLVRKRQTMPGIDAPCIPPGRLDGYDIDHETESREQINILAHSHVLIIKMMMELWIIPAYLG